MTIQIDDEEFARLQMVELNLPFENDKLAELMQMYGLIHHDELSWRRGEKLWYLTDLGKKALKERDYENTVMDIGERY